MIICLGILAFLFLNWGGEDDAITICAIIGAILAIPGGILGALCETFFGFSVAGLVNSTIGNILSTAVGRFFVNAFRFFLLPFIVACLILMFF
ncbi:MAG: hypothetical protein MJZ82_05875 [Paludibacteraceae bacterium]|nr:hypothetical protein [Paludibacteraceae bacterium]